MRVSLAGVAQWIRSLGRVDPRLAFSRPSLALPAGSIPWPEELAKYSTKLRQARSDHDRSDQSMRNADADLCCMTAIGHAAKLSVTAVREGEAPLRLNAPEKIK